MSKNGILGFFPANQRFLKALIVLIGWIKARFPKEPLLFMDM